MLSSMRRFIFVFSQVHAGFRHAEMESICNLYGIPCDNNISLLCNQQHVYVFEFPSVDNVILILSRSVLIKFAVEWIASCNNYDELCVNIKERRNVIKNCDSADQSFAIRIRSIGRKCNRIALQSIIADIGKALDFKESPVDLTSPCNTFYVIEDYGSNSLQKLHFGKLIGCGQGQLKNDYSLADRCYIGNTTIDPELSFLQVNIAKVDIGSLVLDPFCGTGGLLIAAAHFGAAVLGSEINYQIARAVGRSSRAGVECNTAKESVVANFQQYGTDVYFMGLVIADSSQHLLWRPGTHSGTFPVFDAIITDPPYGVRERGQKVGIKEKKESWIIKNAQHANHYPEKAKYSISSTFLDLIDFASKLLVIGGRLLFWFPVFDDEYSEAILPKHDAMKLIYNCEQSLSRRYSRRLLVYEKLRMVKGDEKTYVEKNCYDDVPCTGGTTTHILEAVGTERLAFKVKLKEKYYDLYQVSPPLGFVKPGVKKKLFLRRLPGKPGKTKLVVEYIASPEGYDPRKPFIEGAEVGVLNLRVRAYSDKKLPDKTPKITGKLVTKTGQKFTPTIGYDDLKIETEIEQLFKDKEKLVSSKMKKKEVKEKVEKEVKGKVEKELKGKVEKEVKEKIEKEGKKKVEKEVKEKTEKEGKGKPEKEEEEKEESPSSSDENGEKKSKKDNAPIQVVIPNLWKDLNVAQMQKSNDELKVILEAVTNENKRLEEVIKQMMQEITFLRESLLSIVMKLGTVATTGVATAATTSADGGQAALTTPISTSPMAGKSGSAISASKTSAATDVSLTATSHAAGGVSASSVGATGTKSPVSRTASGAKSPISVGKGGKFDQTGAGAEIDNYLSAMLAGGGPTGGAKKSDGSSPTDAGEKKEFSLYFTGYAGGSKNSTYISASSPSTAKAKDLSFAFGNTADQLGSSGRPYSPSGSPSSGSGGGRAYRTSSVYL